MVFARSSTGSNRVAQNLVASRGSLELWRVCQSSDDAHLCECAGGGGGSGTESAAGERRQRGAAESEHDCDPLGGIREAVGVCGMIEAVVGMVLIEAQNVEMESRVSEKKGVSN